MDILGPFSQNIMFGPLLFNWCNFFQSSFAGYLQFSRFSLPNFLDSQSEQILHYSNSFCFSFVHFKYFEKILATKKQDFKTLLTFIKLDWFCQTRFIQLNQIKCINLPLCSTFLLTYLTADGSAWHAYGQGWIIFIIPKWNIWENFHFWQTRKKCQAA